jgi:proton glutamate symport protein
MKNLSRLLFFCFLLILAVSCLLHVLMEFGVAAIDPLALCISRLVALVLFFFIAYGRRSLTMWIFFAMLAGAEFGHDLPAIAVHLNVVSQVFIRLIKTIIAPLLFGTLVVGIAGHSDLKQVGRMGWKSILYFEIVSTLALFIGLAAINISGAGIGVTVPASVGQGEAAQLHSQSAEEIILHIFPENIAKAIYEGQVLQIVIFTIIFGIAVALLNDKFRLPVVRFAEILSEVMFKFTHLVMYFAPFAVFAAISFSVGSMGLGILLSLFKLLATLYVALAAFLLLILLPVMLLLKIPVRKFYQAVAEPAALAFATTSSEAALPIAMENMEKFGVPRKIVAFVIPTGYSFNLDGSTLYLALASVFVAQIAGVPLSFGTQLMMMLTLMLTSKGAAGVPRASLMILLATTASFGLPSWPVFIILGIDALMDMGRTAVNVIGNCLATVVIAKWEREI